MEQFKQQKFILHMHQSINQSRAVLDGTDLDLNSLFVYRLYLALSKYIHL